MEKLNIDYKDGEIFKQINHFPNYYVSNCGRVFSIKSKQFIGSVNKKIGYKMVTLSEGKRTITTYIHALVMEYFGDPKPNDEYEIDHKDKNKENNSINNLRWVSHQENLMNRNEYTKDRKKRVGKKEIENFNRWYILKREELYELSNEKLAEKFCEEKNISINPVTIKNNRDRWRLNDETDRLTRIPDDELI